MSAITTIYEKIFGSQHDKAMKHISPLVDAINAKEEAFRSLSDEQLRAKTDEFKQALVDGSTLDDILVDAFATVRETGRRLLGMRHYDVQLIGGIALHKGMIAEMRTGEGKTLVATLPTYLNALEGKGVHVITVNDYLAQRDAVWMAQIYDFLGLTTAVIQNQRISYQYDATVKADMQEGSEADSERDDKGSYKIQHDYLRPISRQEAYRCDITYGTNNEFGFDYLRDNMVQDRKDMVMRPGDEMHYAVIDEIDSILIDEARTPLIISAPAAAATDQYYVFAKLVKKLQENTHYNVDEKLRSATLTEDGITFFEQSLGVDNLYVEGGIRMVHHIEQALKAEIIFKRDKDYVVEQGQVVIIDEFTGRKMPGRRYSEGLHQAIEAKEGVEIKRESQTLANITFQNLFRMYDKLSGMTGTAATEEEEFRSIYNLDVLVIPTNKPDARIDHPDRIYKDEQGKYQAIAEKIKDCQAKGQPILVGTISVEKNEALSLYLTSQGITHEALNAKNHEREGEIVAMAGKPGAVTLATNMAGRGVDIKLGGPGATKEAQQEVLDAGGLFVLGTERHESRRIDNQLRGRSARQGDKGETQFFVSTQDDLMRIFAGDRLRNLMQSMQVPDDMPIENKLITKMLESSQKKVESHHYDIRKHVLNYDDILNKQRHAIYDMRREILDIAADQLASAEQSTAYEGKTLRDTIMQFVEQEIEFVVSYHTSATLDHETGMHEDQWNVQEIYETAKTILPLNDEDKQYILSLVPEKHDKMDDIQLRETLVQYLLEKANLAYDAIRAQLQQANVPAEQQQQVATGVERSVLLRAIDTLWVQHLVDIDYLRTGIGLQGYGQRDPLIEYKKEAFNLFQRLQDAIQKEVVYSFFKVSIGIQLAPSIMANDKMTLQGAKKDNSQQAKRNQASPSEPKQKMSKKERRKLKKDGK